MGCLWYFPSPDELIFKALFPHSQPVIHTKEEDHKGLKKNRQLCSFDALFAAKSLQSRALLKRLLCNSATPRASGTSGTIEGVQQRLLSLTWAVCAVFVYVQQPGKEINLDKLWCSEINSSNQFMTARRAMCNYCAREKAPRLVLSLD